MLGVLVRVAAAFLLASIGAFLGGGAGLIAGTLLDHALELRLPADATWAPPGMHGWLSLAGCVLGAWLGAAVLALLPVILAGLQVQLARVVVCAAGGICLFGLLHPEGVWAHPTLLLLPFGAALGAAATRPEPTGPMRA